jgi:uncharacterized protein YyaL (SSP411 family)
VVKNENRAGINRRSAQAESSGQGPKSLKASEKRSFQLPEPVLTHLQRLTDETGIFEHANGVDPNREHGYCVEDVGRALIAVLKYSRYYSDPAASRLAEIYLKYLKNSQLEDGRFHNRTSVEGRLSEEPATGDAFGRALWGLGYAVAHPLNSQTEAQAKELFDRTLQFFPVSKIQKWIRASAYSVLGLCYYLNRYPESSPAKENLTRLADFLLELYEDNSTSDWSWFEDHISYDNARVPHCLFAAYEAVKQHKYIPPARESLDFLINVNFSEGQMLQAVGNRGWYHKGRECPKFDQQPINAAGLVEACAAAYRILGLEKYKDLMISSFRWFLGHNTLGLPVYDASSGGSYDGLCPDGVNKNQGAESNIMYLIANLTVREALGQTS